MKIDLEATLVVTIGFAVVIITLIASHHHQTPPVEVTPPMPKQQPTKSMLFSSPGEYAENEK